MVEELVRVWAVEQNPSHVRDVEDADPVPNSEVLFRDARVPQGHLETGGFRDPALLSVILVEWGFFQLGGLRWTEYSLFKRGSVLNPFDLARSGANAKDGFGVR